MSLLEKTLQQIGDLDRGSMDQTQVRLNDLIKPPGSLGVLEEMVLQLSGIYGDPMPKSGKKVIIVMGADHGVVQEGVSAFPPMVTLAMMPTFADGIASVCVLGRHAGAEIVTVDIGVDGTIDHPGIIDRKIKFGTDNMLKGPAMSREEAIKAIETGIEIANNEISKGARILGTGDMGIGNTTASSAILSVLGDLTPEEVTGRGTGVDDNALKNKTEIIRKAIELNAPDKNDPVDVLAKVGGLEIGGIVGTILSAAANRIPVVVDGFISSAGALIAARLSPKSVNFMIPSHCSAEQAHRTMLECIGLRPMLDMKMRLGEGTGAALAISALDASIKMLHEVGTFKDIGM
ncbi:nicotinate-nucleotide--dimethylbenzimidazole phosphoribosyltransferase [Phosphitispora sp. TUW77]|uniref:nicotinate-nucleotide--dimethylbenzimidazole phosphoribosyltransferase n=1 Tax=Phosphitispora sp. TUW77 TaxID=3152361 RepID=UPI003AB12D36